MEREVAPERNGWRDEAISRRHRQYGFNCPAVDLDFVLVEYASGKPKAIVDYKHENATAVDPRHPSFAAIRSLCEWHEPPLPCWIAYYRDQPWRYKVKPLNERAEDLFGHDPAWMTEREYVAMLYLIRFREVPEQAKAILAGLDNEAQP